MSELFTTLLSDDERQAVSRPIEYALTLPNAAFTSEEWFAAEVEKIYNRSWVAYCFEDELPDPGDVLPRDLINVPLVAVRGTDQTVRVFHNVCPYDGCPVALERQRGRTVIRAPYHGWRYSLTGELVGTPYWDGTPDGPQSLGERPGDLEPVAADTFMGILFVNMGATPQPFHDYIAPLADILQPWDLDALAPGEPSMGEGGPGYSFTVAANWKTFYENTCVNVLHEAFTHGRYNKSPQVPRVRDGVKTYWDHVDRGLLALAYDHKEFEVTYPPLGFPHIGLGEKPANSFFAALFPNLHIGITADFIVPILAFPDRPDRTVIYETYLLHRDAAAEPAFRTAREAVYYSWRIAHMEDQRVIEGVQRARHSPATNQMFYSPFWDLMHYELSQMVLAAVEAE